MTNLYLAVLVDEDSNKHEIEYRYGLQERGKSITNLIWSNPSNGYNHCTLSYAKGVVKTFDLTHQKAIVSKDLKLDKSLTPVGLLIRGEDPTDKQQITYLTEDGQVSTCQLSPSSSEEDETTDLFKIKLRGEKQAKRLLDVPQEPNQCLVLGEMLPQVWDMSVQKNVWTGKNLPNDYMDLEVPLDDFCGAFDQTNPRYFLTGTSQGEIRLYDVKHQRRPMKNYEKIETTPISNIALTNDGFYAIYSNQLGHLTMVDRRKDMQMVHRMKGHKGSVRDIQIEGQYVVSTGLDRFVRIYHYETKELHQNVYLKQKMNRILIDPSSIKEVETPEEPEEEKKEENEEPITLGRRSRRVQPMQSKRAKTS